jgi:hypothetical protein
MGSGSRVKQYERRFHEGEQTREKREDEVFRLLRVFGDYEIYESNSGG